MHRIYTKEQYIEKVALLRSIAPKAKLGTDIIVGFCSETDAEFEETYQLFDEIGFSVAFIFAYSPRKGTPAMRWQDDVPEEVKQQRLHRLLELYEKKAQEERLELVNTPMEVLVEGKNKNGQLKGTTRCWKNVILEGDDSLIGTLQMVDISGFNHSTLIGTVKKPLIV
jgi:tRNA-2-methylthio-N6-dimethylallyladenosine synthase